MPNDGTGAFWDESHPANADVRRLGAQEIRDLRIGIRARFSKEFITAANGSVGGGPRNGSARAFYQGSAPTQSPDGTRNLGVSSDAASGDYGRLWVDANQKLWVWNDGTFVAGGSVPGSGWLEMIAEVAAGRKVHVHQFNGGGSINYTFPFAPVVVIILGNRIATGTNMTAQIGWIRQAETTFTKFGQSVAASSACSLSGTTFTMSSTNEDFNGSGIVYTMIALG